MHEYVKCKHQIWIVNENNILTDNDICEGVIDALYELNVSQTIKCYDDLINKYNISNLSDLSTKELLLYSLNDALNMFE